MKHLVSGEASMRRRLLTTTLLAGLSLAAPLAVTAVTVLSPGVASAQDYSSGTLAGTVENTGGEAQAGAAVTVKSLGQGFTRTTTTDAQGQFRFPLIPLGAYSVTITKEGYRPTTAANVRVIQSSESRYTFNLSGVDEVAALEVTATANPALDFSATTKGVTLDVETLVKQVPIARDITAVALLAPTAVQGDSFFGSQPSIGGSSVAENAFFINGLNITNFDTYVGGGDVPFDFYKSVEVKTGGYAAEFGRATGGVVNAVTKSGANDFMFAVHGNYALKSLRDRAPNVYDDEGGLIRPFDKTRVETKSTTFEAGGPIIRDHLFAYALYEMRDNSNAYAPNAQETYASSFRREKSDSPFWGGKIDAVITDRQRVEFTYFDTTRETHRRNFALNNGTVGAEAPPTILQYGGENYIAKYTGTFTDWFTLSGAYGESKDRNNILPEGADQVVVVDNRTLTNTIISNQRTASTETQDTTRKFYRADADFYFNLMGKHHIRVGYDQEETTLNHETIRTGGNRYILRRGTGPTAGYGVPLGQDFVEVAYLRLGGQDVGGKNQSFYVQDAWDITPDLSLQIGVRDDIFSLHNLAGEEFLHLKNNWGPRLGFTWDPGGKGQDKVYGSFGRYFIPPASNVAYRGRDTGFSEFFYLPAGGLSFGANGAPVLGQQMTLANNPNMDVVNNIVACPGARPGTENVPIKGAPGAVGCQTSFGVGIAEPALSKTTTDLKATLENEFILGYQRRLNPLWTVGAALTFRQLKRVSEDTTLDPLIVEYCERNGIAGCEDIWDGSWQYAILNPGKDINIYTRGPLPGRTEPEVIHISAADAGYATPKREYIGLEVSFERAFDGKWGLQGSYVRSSSRGNYEGTVLSDVGQDDAGTTQLYDFRGLQDFQSGFLPNHHAHQFKAFGSYAITENFLIGANVQVISPRKYSCLGANPTDPYAAAYGAASRYCAGEPARRGTLIESDWLKNLDLSFRYTVPKSVTRVADVVLRADLFNVFNSHAATQLDELYDEDGATRLPTYGSVFSYQAPRSLRVGFDLTF